ncbi:MAG: adenylate/guanylate cyclase domain-containing protein [Geminicoccaceae bacterium]
MGGAELAMWLVGVSEQRLPLPHLFEGFCNRLVADEIPLSHALLGLEVLHPELSGTLLRWQDGELEKIHTQRAGILTSDSYLRSPTRIVDETNKPFRWRAGEDTMEMPRLEAYAAEGVTDYVMLPLPFLDQSRTAVTAFTTRAQGGFSDAQMQHLDVASRLLSPWAERAVLRKISIDLLAAYLGPEAGRRVFEGQIERGDVQTIKAAIWFCDLRGFTAMSDRFERQMLIRVMNRWFDIMGTAIEKAGGEILKFMGDGLLAVFPLDGDHAGTCERVLDAVGEAFAGTEELNQKLAAKGEAPMRFGLALHAGDVEFGNIGTAHRLDFTVIGPAVNMASRLEGLTKELGVPVVASAAFAGLSGRSLRSYGRHRLRGIAEPAEVFGLEEVVAPLAAA